VTPVGRCAGSPLRPFAQAFAADAYSGGCESNEVGAMTVLIPANAEHKYSVTSADLPLSCPMPGMYLWNSHPKVYLPIEPTGWAKCAYCGAEFTLLR
jgi:uncharacterized Zn-finger protein